MPWSSSEILNRIQGFFVTTKQTKRSKEQTNAVTRLVLECITQLFVLLPDTLVATEDTQQSSDHAVHCYKAFQKYREGHALKQSTHRR